MLTMTVNESDTEGDIIYSTGQGWRRVGEPPQAIPGPKSLEQYAREHEDMMARQHHYETAFELAYGKRIEDMTPEDRISTACMMAHKAAVRKLERT